MSYEGWFLFRLECQGILSFGEVFLGSPFGLFKLFPHDCPNGKQGIMRGAFPEQNSDLVRSDLNTGLVIKNPFVPVLALKLAPHLALSKSLRASLGGIDIVI